MHNKTLHLDFDHTLANTLYADNEKHADQLLETYSIHWDGVKFESPNDGWYVSFIRNWSKELIQYFQLTIGLNNVCILSWGSNEYVLKASHLLDIGISPVNIFTREDIPYTVPRFKNKNNVLVDNENYAYHRAEIANKVNFLFCLEPEKLVQVQDFDVRYFREGFNDTLEELIKKIEKAFEYEEE